MVPGVSTQILPPSALYSHKYAARLPAEGAINDGRAAGVEARIEAVAAEERASASAASTAELLAREGDAPTRLSSAAPLRFAASTRQDDNDAILGLAFGQETLSRCAPPLRR
jgi:hypothetical protein